MRPPHPRASSRRSVRLWLLAFVFGNAFVWLSFHFPIYTAHGSGTLDFLKLAWSVITLSFGRSWRYPGEWFAAHPAMFPAVPVAALLYLGVLWALWREELSIGELCLWATAIGLPFVIGPRFQSSDLSDYLVRSRMQFLYHLNPFVYPPKFLMWDPFLVTAAWPSVRWVYGPLFLLFMAPFSRLPSTLSALLLARLAMFALHLTNGFLIWKVSAGDSRRRTVFAAAYLLSPLLIIESAGNAHNDFLMILFFLLAMLAGKRDRTVLTSLSLGAAFLVKLYAAPVLVCFGASQLRKPAREIAKAVLPATAAVLVFYAPFWRGPATIAAAFDGGSSRRVMHSLLTVAHMTTGLPEALLSQAGLVLTALAIIIGGLVSYRTRRWELPAAYTMFFWCAVGSGWFWPWYVAAPAALALSAGDRALRWGALSLLVTTLALYVDPHLWGSAFGLGTVVLSAIFVVPLGLVALMWHLRHDSLAQRVADEWAVVRREAAPSGLKPDEEEKAEPAALFPSSASLPAETSTESQGRS